MRSSTVAVLCLTISIGARGQSRAAEMLRRTGDSSAVAQFVERYHAALAADDTATVYQMLAPSFAYVDEDEIRTLADMRAGTTAAKGRWERAVEREKKAMHVRVNGETAWAYWVWPMHARGQQDLLRGTESELVVLTRQGTSWQIATIHWSLKGS